MRRLRRRVPWETARRERQHFGRGRTGVRPGARHREGTREIASEESPWPISSWGKFLRDRERTSEPEGARGNLQAGRGLLALVLVAINAHGDGAHQLQGKTVL